MNPTKFGFLTCLVLLMCFENDAVIFKLTKVYCESLNKTWVTVNECRVKPKSWNLTLMNIEADIHYPVYESNVMGSLKKKENGYKPFLYSLDVDGCKFLSKPSNPVAKLVYSLFKEFSSINHPCPYLGKNGVRNFYLKSELLRGLPLPSGEYQIPLTWIFHKKATIITNAYFVFEEDPMFNVQHG